MAAPHLPGFGDSEASGDVMTMRAAAERALAAMERGIDRAVVCGLSMGGYVAFEVWRRARERVAGLVLANTRAVADPPEAAAPDGRSPNACDRRATSWPKSLALLSDGAPEEPRTRPRLDRGPVAEAIAAALLGMAERPDSTPDLATIRVPTLVLTSTEDRMIAPEVSAEMAGLIPQGALTIGAAGICPTSRRPRRSTRRCSSTAGLRPDLSDPAAGPRASAEPTVDSVP